MGSTHTHTHTNTKAHFSKRRRVKVGIETSPVVTLSWVNILFAVAAADTAVVFPSPDNGGAVRQLKTFGLVRNKVSDGRPTANHKMDQHTEET